MSELGRFMVTRNEADIGAFRTSQLRNVGITAPYMHDGSMQTLWDAMDHYNKGGEPNHYLDGGIEPLALTEQEIDQLVAFMFTLTDGRFAELQRQRARAAARAGRQATSLPRRQPGPAQGHLLRPPGRGQATCPRRCEMKIRRPNGLPSVETRYLDEREEALRGLRRLERRDFLRASGAAAAAALASGVTVNPHSFMPVDVRGRRGRHRQARPSASRTSPTRTFTRRRSTTASCARCCGRSTTSTPSTRSRTSSSTAATWPSSGRTEELDLGARDPEEREGAACG